MKKRFLFILILILMLFCGCGKKGESSILKDLNKKIKNMDQYQVTGLLNITNNDDNYNYDVVASYKKDDNYRVSLTNKSNNHEQIILKNETGVYVVTPSLNKSFKFQSEWPHNNSQIYLLESLMEDLNENEERTFEETEDGYIFTTKVNYPNNVNLKKQKIYLTKDLDFKMVEVLDQNDIPNMVMEFTNIDSNPVFQDDFFELDSIIDNIDTETKEETTGSIDDIIYPLYIPTGTVLSDQEKVAKDDGERIILTFDGDKPFLLVEETSSVEKEFSIIPTFGEPYLLGDSLGALSTNSLSWSSNGIDYYLVSDVMNQLELIEIANSISAIPTIK